MKQFAKWGKGLLFCNIKKKKKKNSRVDFTPYPKRPAKERPPSDLRENCKSLFKETYNELALKACGNRDGGRLVFPHSLVR